MGYSREDLISGKLRWDQLTPQRYHGTYEDLFRQLRRRGTYPPWEKEYLHKDGHPVPVLVVVTAVDEPTADCIGFVIDRTERRRFVEALRQSEERYRQLLAAVTTYTYSVTLDAGMPASTEHSSGCIGATGYSPADYRNNPALWIEMVPAEDRPMVREHVDAVLAGQSMPPLEHRIVHKDGSTRWLRDTIVPHRDAAGHLVRYDGLVEDITERKRIEERFRQLLESAPDAMLVTDRSGWIVLVNEQTERVFGYRREELLGRSVEMLVPGHLREIHARHRAAYMAQPRARAMNSGMELSAVDKSGREFPAEISLRPVATEEGMLVFCAIRDITERKKAERELRENAAQLLAAQRIQQHLLPRQAPTSRDWTSPAPRTRRSSLPATILISCQCRKTCWALSSATWPDTASGRRC